MIYISFGFYVFVAAVAAAYYVIPLNYRWYALLIGSLGFYWYISHYSKKSFLILLFLALVCWLAARLMGQERQNRKSILCISCLVVLIPLLIIKEAGFVMDFILHRNLPGWWFVPIGFSFYTLQLVAYCADVYRKKIKPEENFLKFLLFVSFFPQIIQGPIPRYGQLSDQLIKGNRFDEEKFVKGFMLILWGFFLKLCIADKAGIIVDTIFNNYSAYRGMYVLVGGILYSFQLYADFQACTCLAQGVSGLFCIDIINNFDHPYLATSIKDFWRRWHISLSTWLRDYVYIPLGGNRKGKVRKYINLLVTFAISGIWHGAGFKFLFWGLLHGVYQVTGELLMPIRQRIREKLHVDIPQAAGKLIETIITFTLVMLAWIIFRADRLGTGLSMIASIFTVRNLWIFTDDSLFNLGLVWKEFYLLVICLLILLAVSLMQERGIRIRDRILKQKLVLRWAIYIIAIVFIMVFGTYGWGYNSQDFIYGRF